MKKLLSVIAVALLFCSCKPGVPRNIVQPNEMQKVLVEIHLTDAYIATLPSQDSAKKIASMYYNGIYKKYDTDSAQYNKSLNYYYTNPEVFLKIYEGVSKELSEQKTKMAKIDSIENVKAMKKQIEKQKADSIKIADSLKKIVQKKSIDTVKKPKKIFLKRNAISQ